MKDVYVEYKEKLVTADEAASFIKAGDKIFYGEFVKYPEALDEASPKEFPCLKISTSAVFAFQKFRKLWRRIPNVNMSL